MKRASTQAVQEESNSVRAVNVRRGMTKERMRSRRRDHWKKRFPELEAQLLDAYYKFKGWNNDGIPTKESLQELNLDYVAEEFEKRGIYSDNEGGPPKRLRRKKRRNKVKRW